VVEEPFDLRGFPSLVAHQNRAEFRPFGFFADLLAATTPTVWFIDDLGQGDPAVQKAYMQVVWARRIGDHRLPECLAIVAATNRVQDRAGVTFLAPLKTRFVTCISVEPHVDDFTAWALTHQIHPDIIGFLRYRPHLLMGDASPEITGYPCPRAWAHVSTLLSLTLGEEEERDAVAGAIGSGAATEFAAYRTSCQSIVSWTEIHAAPETFPLPTTLSGRTALCALLAYHCTPTTFPTIATVITRLDREHLKEYAVLAWRDCLIKEPSIGTVPEFIQLAQGPLGRLVRGA
jgi:hypothetical protein